MYALARLLLVFAAAAAALASASATSNTPSAHDQRAPQITSLPPEPPTSVPMDPSVVLGLWKSNFGPVKIESNLVAGSNALMGVWLYERDEQEVVGYFSGETEGNVFRFTWQEPTTTGPELSGSGYLVFDPEGGSYTGRWWATDRTRDGDWNGWRKKVISASPDLGSLPPNAAPQGAPAPTPEVFH